MDTIGLEQQNNKGNRTVKKIRRVFILFIVAAAALFTIYVIYHNAQRTIVTVRTGEHLSVKLRLPKEFMDQPLQDGTQSDSRSYIHRQKLRFSLFKYSNTKFFMAYDLTPPPIVTVFTHEFRGHMDGLEIDPNLFVTAVPGVVGKTLSVSHNKKGERYSVSLLELDVSGGPYPARGIFQPERMYLIYVLAHDSPGLILIESVTPAHEVEYTGEMMRDLFKQLEVQAADGSSRGTSTTLDVYKPRIETRERAFR